jgi:hypothetical protein
LVVAVMRILAAMICANGDLHAIVEGQGIENL